MREVIRVGLLALNIALLFLLLQSCGCSTARPSRKTHLEIEIKGVKNYLLKSEITPFNREDYENMEIALEIIQQIDPAQGGWTFQPTCFWFESKTFGGLTIGVNRDVTERIVLINKSNRITSVNYFLGNFIDFGAVLAHELTHVNAGVEDPRCGELTDQKIYGILKTNSINIFFNQGVYSVGR